VSTSPIWVSKVQLIKVKSGVPFSRGGERRKVILPHLSPREMGAEEEK
jgi:hypothetical protein